MINHITIKNYKVFNNEPFDLGALNLLTGLNGTGKSSLIQVLLLLSQSKNELDKQISLKGEYLNLGRLKDIFSFNGVGEELTFSLTTSTETFTFNFSAKKDELNNDYLLLKDTVSINYKKLALFSSNSFEYLNANRINPQLFYPHSRREIELNNSLGRNGEYTAHYLAINRNEDIGNGDEDIIEKLKHRNTAEKTTLLIQTKLWLSDISPGINIKAYEDDISEIARLTYSYTTTSLPTEDIRTMNTGFGITYVLPVIVAILKAKKGDLVIIENPEAHIHPRGQVWLGELFAIAAECGIQLIIETHSDHILNGIRYAAKQKKVTAENVNILYFDRDMQSEEHKINIYKPKLTQKGKIDKWPAGFFDSWDDIVFKLI